MRRPALLRAGLLLSAAALSGALGWQGWKLWETGASEGKRAWDEGRVIALAMEKPTPEAAAPTPPSQAELKDAAQEPEPPHSSQVAEEDPDHPAPANNAPALADGGGLTEQTKEGALPIIGKDGVKPWQKYARPFTRQGKTPVIAIVITGLGMSRNASESALDLPADITLSFSPYADNTSIWVNAGRGKGHEALIDLPLEPEGFPANDPGPLALLSINSPEENARRLRQVLGRAGNVMGLYLPPQEVFTAQEAQAKIIADQLSPRGVMVLTMRTDNDTAFAAVVKTSSLAALNADILLDNELTPDAIKKQLAAAEALALSRGYAIAVARPNQLSLKEITKWSAGLSQRGFQLAPLSFLAKLKFS